MGEPNDVLRHDCGLADVTASMQRVQESIPFVEAAPVELESDCKHIGEANEESRARIEKAALEIKKIQLETQLLTIQLSPSGRAMEWLKSVSVPVAVLGAAITLYIGFGQIKQAEENRNADRFDKALSRLASEKANVRITGVSGLRLFVVDSSSSLQLPALSFLINAASVESDSLVQGAILDVFSDLKKGVVSQAGLNEALRTAIEQDRSLTKSISAESRHRIAISQLQVVYRLKSIQPFPGDPPNEIPRRLVAKLSQGDYLDFLDDDKSEFEDLAKIDSRLVGLTELISILIGLGASGKDFSAIYCERCDFSASTNLSTAKFDGSYLNRANFSHVNLKGASFRNSDLRGAVFFSADLSSADLTNSHVSDHPGFLGTGASFPLLECADLRGTDLTGIPLLTFERDYSEVWARSLAFRVTAPAMILAKIDSTTKLSTFDVTTYTNISDSYLKGHSKEYVVSPLHSDSYRMADDPLLRGSQEVPYYHRLHGAFAVEEEKFTSTMYSQFSKVGIKELPNLLDVVKPRLKGYLNQPPLLTIPLLRDFDQALEMDKAMVSQKGSGDSPQDHWKSTRPYACSDGTVPEAQSLILDSGYHPD